MDPIWILLLLILFVIIAIVLTTKFVTTGGAFDDECAKLGISKLNCETLRSKKNITEEDCASRGISKEDCQKLKSKPKDSIFSKLKCALSKGTPPPKKIEADPTTVKKSLDVFNRMANAIADIAKTLPDQYRGKDGKYNLDAMYQDKCVEGSEWKNSLFCAMGEGNELANMIFRLRFSVPSSPERHALYNFINDKDANYIENPAFNDLLKEFIKALFQKINRNEQLTWNDLPAYAILAAKYPAIKNKMLEPQMQNMGLTMEPVSDNTHDHVKGPQSLNGLRDMYCKPGGLWQNTLFCALAGNDREHYIAEALAKLKFTIPKGGPNEHIIGKLLKTLKAQLAEMNSKLSWFSLSDLGKSAGLKTAISKMDTLITKIERSQLLTWDDINSLFTIASLNLMDIVEPIAANNLNSMGMDIAVKSPEYINDGTCTLADRF